MLHVNNVAANNCDNDKYKYDCISNVLLLQGGNI